MVIYDRYRHSLKSFILKKLVSLFHLLHSFTRVLQYFSLEQLFRKISCHFTGTSRKLPNFDWHIAKLKSTKIIGRFSFYSFPFALSAKGSLFPYEWRIHSRGRNRFPSKFKAEGHEGAASGFRGRFNSLEETSWPRPGRDRIKSRTSFC